MTRDEWDEEPDCDEDENEDNENYELDSRQRAQDMQSENKRWY